MLYEDEDEEDFEEFIVYPDDDVSEPLGNIREEEEEDGRTETK